LNSFARKLAGLLTFPNLLVVILWCSPLLFGGARIQGGSFLRDPDIWWHLRNAQVLVTTHHFLTTDLYSFTTGGQPWINPEWLAELPYYAAYHFWGVRGLYYVTFIVFEIMLAGVFRIALLRSRDFTASYVATFAFVMFAMVNFGPRTILFGWLSLVVELLIFEAARHRPKAIWWLVPLFTLWINFHGSWMIGVVLFVVYAASGLVAGHWGAILAERWKPAQIKRLIAVGGASFVALFINPYGWRLVFYPFDFAFQQRLNVSRGEEWLSLDFHTGNGKFFLFVVLCIAVLSLLRRRTWRLHEVFFALIAIYSAATYVRFLFLAGILLAPMIATEIAQDENGPEPEPDRNRPLLNATLMLAVLAFVIYRFPKTSVLSQGREAAFPQAAFARLNTFNPQDRVFNSYAYGGYMIWSARSTPTFLDSRTDIFEHHGILADYAKAIDFHDPLAIFDQYKIRYVFFPKSDPLIYLLTHTRGWKTNFDQGGAVIMERSTTPA